MTTYQRLKKENAELKNELHVLVTKPTSVEALKIKAKVEMQARIEKDFWFGDLNQQFEKTKGLLEVISQKTTKH